MRNPSITLTFAVSLVACGNPSTTPESPDAGSSLHFETPEYTVQPGEEVRYICTSVHVPMDGPTTITKIIPTYGPGTHHLVLWQALIPDQEGTWMCPEVTKIPGWAPVLVRGTTPEEENVPSGLGIILPPGQQLILQLHLLNTTKASISGHAAVDIETTTKAVTQAGNYGFQNTMFSVPAAASNYPVNMDCVAPHDFDVYAEFGHMHQIGTNVTLLQNGAPLFTVDPWSFDNQIEVRNKAHISMGDKLTLQCIYNNPSMKPVDQGTSTLQEMCAAFLTYSPYSKYGGCLDGTNISF